MNISKQQLLLLYKSGKSMAEISIVLNCSIHKVSYWMKKYRIKSRSHSQATYIKENPDGDPFKIKQKRSKKENLLYGIALGLFWGEGTKATPYSVRLTNTDPSMIRIFRKFLLEICQVNKMKIRYSLVTFQDTDPEKATEFWGKSLGISKQRFGTIVSIPTQGKGTYKKKSLYGVCTITVSNIKLKSWIMDQIEKIKQAWVV